MISQRNDRIKLPCLRTVVHAAYISSQGRNRKVGLRAELVILRSFVMAVALFAVIKPFYEPLLKDRPYKSKYQPLESPRSRPHWKIISV